MYYTSRGWERVTGPLWSLFLNAANNLVELILEDRKFPTGIAVFDKLSAKTRIMLINEVCQRMNDPQSKLDIYSFHDATVAAVLASLQSEIDVDWDNFKSMRAFTLRDIQAVCEELWAAWEPRDRPKRQRYTSGLHKGLIKSPKKWWQVQAADLHEVYLADSDYELENLIADSPSDELKQLAGIHPDYFAMAPDRDTKLAARRALHAFRYLYWQFNPGTQKPKMRIPEHLGTLDTHVTVCLHKIHVRYDLRYTGADGEQYVLTRTKQLTQSLIREARSRARKLINKGYREGELNCLYAFDTTDQPPHHTEPDMEIRGWWDIIRE